MVKYNIVELTDMDLPRLQTIATDLGLTDIKGVEKQALIYQILDRQAESVAGMQKEKEAQKSEQKRRGPGRPPKNKSAESAAEASAAEKEPKADTTEKAESKPAKRRPGRPKKNKAAEPTEAAAPAAPATAETTEAAPKAETKEEAEAAESKPAKRRPGRPKKSKSAAAPVAETPASIAETEPILATEPMLEAEEMPVESPVAAPIAPVSPVVPPSAAAETAPQASAAAAHEAKPSPEAPTAAPATPPAPEEPKRTIFKHATDTPSVLDQVLPMQPPAPQPKDKQQNEAKKRPQQNHRPNNPNLRENAPVVPPPPIYDFDGILTAAGVLEIVPDGYGFLRSSDYNYMPSPDDVFVSQYQIRSYALKMGDVVECKVKVPREGEKYFSLVSIDRINGLDPRQVRDRVAFEHLTPLFPDEQFKLSNGRNTPLACRVVDLFSPIGKGQRALIVAQPKTGKTILMKQIANAIAANYPDTYLMMLLIDERPEEVTDMARTVNAEVIASTFDEPATRHVRIAQMVLDKAKRMVECGHDVVIFLDSITRLARAFNTTAPASGKILTGGVDANALQKPKRFFGAARNIEGGGSLTIIATALIDTGSKMDEVIFEEFKGTGNMELQLDRSLANKRIFPAVNLIQSSTRRDDLLLDENTLNRMYVLRNYMGDMNSMEAMNFVKKNLENSLSNEEFLATMNK